MDSRGRTGAGERRMRALSLGRRKLYLASAEKRQLLTLIATSRTQFDSESAHLTGYAPLDARPPILSHRDRASRVRTEQ